MSCIYINICTWVIKEGFHIYPVIFLILFGVMVVGFKIYIGVIVNKSKVNLNARLTYKRTSCIHHAYMHTCTQVCMHKHATQHTHTHTPAIIHECMLKCTHTHT